jgi:hypothetical protein
MNSKSDGIPVSVECYRSSGILMLQSVDAPFQFTPLVTPAGCQATTFYETNVSLVLAFFIFKPSYEVPY